MKALVLDKPGKLGYLHMADSALPEPGEGEVRVRVHAVALNPIDYKLVFGGGYPNWSFPFVLGLDVAGTIDAIGLGVQGWQVGDRVLYHGDLSRQGGYAEYATVVSHVITRIPDTLSYTDAAAIPCAGYTAYQALTRKLHLQAGQTILIQGGAGGVGSFGVQIAVHIGATVLATGATDSRAFIEKLGAHHVIDYQTQNVKERVMTLTHGRGVDAVFDTVGRATATESLDMLAFFGGIAYIVEDLIDFSKVRFEKATSLHGVSLGGAHISGDRPAQEDLARMGTELVDLVVKGAVVPMVTETISLEHIPEALSRLSERRTNGKIIAVLV